MGCSMSQTNDEEQGRRENSGNEFGFMTPNLQKMLTSKNPTDLLKSFVQLDKAIMEEEKKNPSAAFGSAMSRQQQIKALLHSAMEIQNQNEILSGESSVYDLYVDLGLVKNPKMAMEHEEFFASINRRALNGNEVEFLRKILEKVENEIKTSSESLSQLQSAYHQQDELLGQIFGETYGSDTERLLEKELDTMRYYKDMLSIGVIQWEICVESIQLAVDHLQKAVATWKSIDKKTLQSVINMVTTARNDLQEALLHIRTSAELLQDVQFPYCTTRELKAVSQATDYMYTDVFVPEKYLHTSQVYESFLQRATSLHDWVKTVLESKLQKDLDEIEGNVTKAATQLRNERIYLICKKLKIENLPKDFVQVDSAPVSYRKSKIDFDRFPVDLESALGFVHDGNGNVTNHFRKIVEKRKRTMWPSRRIDELPSLMVQQ